MIKEGKEKIRDLLHREMTFWLIVSLAIHLATLTAIDLMERRHFIKVAAPGPFRVTLIEPRPRRRPARKPVRKHPRHPVRIQKQRIVRTVSRSPVIVRKQRIIRRIKKGAIPTRNPREERLQKTIERLRKQVAQRKNSPPPKPTVPAGGGSVIGERNIYFSVIRSKIMQAWVIPENLIENIYDLKAIVNFTIFADGHISHVYLEESSGNKTFDESAIRAVKQAAPFPPLPASLGKRSLEIGIRFRPEEKEG